MPKRKATKTKTRTKTTKDAPPPVEGWHQPADDSLVWLKAEPGKVSRVRLMAQPHHEYCTFIDRNKIGWVVTLAEYEIIAGRMKILEPGLDQDYSDKPPESRYIVPVILYDVSKDGAPGRRKPRDVEITVNLWSMSEPIYRRLLKQYNTWGEDIFNHDLLLTGVEKGTFKFFDDVSVAKDCLAEHKDLKETAAEEWDMFKFRENFRTMIGRTFTEEELQAKIDEGGKK